ncbi:MAG: zinc-binding dehydrogenase [Halobacteriales archaeon]|nr:zinc-binding dehydrogenase [Halobacteriales archaeon]
MRAVHLTDYGPPEEVLEIRDIQTPEPEPNEVRLEVRACGLQHADVFARVGHPELEPAFPKRPGTEVAGVIDGVGDEVTDWAVGDRVNVYHHFTCGDCEFCERGEQTMCPHDTKLGSDRPGGLAEFLTVPADNLEQLPDSVSFDIGAAWPSSFTTAWRMMVTAGDLRPAESALILGASGGVGHAALQIADRIGATPFATTSTEWKAEKASEWAEAVIDYTDVQFDAAIKELTDGRGVDLVADHVGQETWQQSIDSLATDGRMVICGATSGPDPDIDIRSVYQRHRRIIGAPMGNRQDFRAVGRLIGAGEIAPVIDRRLPLADVAEGHRAIENRDVFGKVVVQPQQ